MAAEGLLPGVLSLTGTARNPQLLFRPDDGSSSRPVGGSLVSAMGALDGWRAAIPGDPGGSGSDGTGADNGPAQRAGVAVQQLAQMELRSRVVAAPPDERVPGDISRMSLVLPEGNRVNAGTAVRILLAADAAGAIVVEVILASEFGIRWFGTPGRAQIGGGSPEPVGRDAAPEAAPPDPAGNQDTELAWIEVPQGSLLDGLSLLPKAR